MPEPHPSRAALEAWLKKVKAEHKWTEEVLGFGLVKCYAVGNSVIFVQDRVTARHDFGWELYVPASDSNTVAETLRNAEYALGLVPLSVTLKTRPNPHHDGQGRPFDRPEFVYHDLDGTLHTGDGVTLYDLVKSVTGEAVKAGDLVHLTVDVEKGEYEEGDFDGREK